MMYELVKVINDENVAICVVESGNPNVGIC